MNSEFIYLDLLDAYAARSTNSQATNVYGASAFVDRFTSEQSTL